jgi:peroxiredoxin
MLFDWHLLRMALAAVVFIPLRVWAGDDPQNEKVDAPAAASISRGDAVSDPLLFLLRAPEIRQKLAIRDQQVEAVEQLVGEIDEPLWRLRDAQFLSAENSTKAWLLIDQTESKLGRVLQQNQETQFRQLLVRARGLQALLSSDVIQSLGLSPLMTNQIAEILEETRKEARQIQGNSTDKVRKDRSLMLKKLQDAAQNRVAALLTNEQKQKWQQRMGRPYDFGQVARRYVRAPELRGVEAWINSEPLRLADLRGKVVVLHFFTFGCINCIHNQPAYKDWHERFSAKGVVVLGIHTPEGKDDRKLDNIRKAIQDQRIPYPVAVDNKKENWTAWANHSWPAVYIIDKEGYVRYWWYGELNWQGAGGERLYRKKIAELL